MKWWIAVGLQCLLLCWGSWSWSQENAAIRLVATSAGRSATDAYFKGKTIKDYSYSDSLHRKIPKAYASVSGQKNVELYFELDTTVYSQDSIRCFNETTGKYLPFAFLNNRGVVPLTNPGKDQHLILMYRGKHIYRVDVLYVRKKTEKMWIVPLFDARIDEDSLQNELNRIFRPTGKSYDVTLRKPFRMENFPQTRLFRNPSEAGERYSQEMRYVRDKYLQLHPELKNAFVVFVIPGFNNPELSAYVVNEKSMLFLKYDNHLKMSRGLAEQLVRNCTTPKDLYVTPKGNLRFPFRIWKTIGRDEVVFSLYDEYEDIPASTGIVGYYFWQEDALGNIILPEKGTREPLNFIRRPYKRNTFSYHLQLDHFWMKTIFSIRGIPFNLLHLLGIIGAGWGVVYAGIRLRRYIKAKWKFPRLFRFMSLPVIGAGILGAGYLIFLLVNLAYSLYEVKAGNIEDFRGLSLKAVEVELRSNQHPYKLQEKALSTEILVQSGENVELRQRGSVLYFDATLGHSGAVEKLRCTDARDSLDIPQFDHPVFAKSHYIVMTYRDEKDERLNTEVYNYLGVNITSTLKAKDPARRILVFVNGYRPTSLGSGLQQHFYDIRKNGLEFPDSYNRLYSFDRYSYWQPWNNIDQRFINVFLPTETYYADGHFSVSTSNYRSILNFSSASTQFPKRCAKGKPHHCFYSSTVKSKIFGARKKKSLNIINYRSNRRGFAKRMENGRVAGRNLYAALNELPNSSKNDTLYIVAHSMGYAYSLGIIEVLRGKINFGSYIIIAPENASAGKVDPKEWKEIWQYGSNLNSKYPDAPCLQDGVAPQALVKGLSAKNRVFIPKELYTHKGFFDSHFIGYFTWIFDIPYGKPGYIKKH